MADAGKGAAFLDKQPTKSHLISPLDLTPRVIDLWERGLPPGAKTGWPSLDAHYTVAPGQVTIVTGFPGAGKSEFLDALLVNLMHQGWRTAIYSPENQPLELHAAKFLEKLVNKPFGRGPTERMSREEVEATLFEVMAGRFTFARVPEDGALSPKTVIEACEPWLLKVDGPRALVMDPWNEMEHFRPRELSETEYVSVTLQRVRTWARGTNTHVFIVAHPQKMRRDTGTGKLPIPTLDMISGSVHWWNKADCGITVYRDPADPDSPEVQIHVQKVRFKHIGRPGLVVLKYNRVTGRYTENVVPWNDIGRERKK